ncbi:MAG TPA: HEAT repeat domain-containing protein [Gemmatimonadales bacterium]|jgi:HEAT repeat protein|nr:HEAT repeat domain-containing protein [Gemmatimonadales bacterium]
MATPQEFAASFARTLDLFRDPGAKEGQKAQFRTLAAILKFAAVTIAAQDGQLLVNGAAASAATLLQRLEFHSVKEIAIPADPPVAELFELLRALADQPADEDIASRLRGNGAKCIAITMQTFHFEAPAPPPPPPPATQPSSPTPPAPVSADSDIPAIVRESTAETVAFSPAAAATRSTADLLAQLRERPDGPHVGELLAILGRQLETAMKANRTPQALTLIAGIVRAEQQVSDATRRRQYSIALKRMYNKALLEAIAEVADHPADREDALLVLRRAGEDGVEVLLDLLVAAPTIEERRGIFMALTGMKEGTDQLVHMLGHHQWFVVRNVAELAGELALDEAVPALAQQLDHEDERVRKAVALALAKIGSSAAVEPLRRALRDESPEVRMQAALGVGGRKSSALAMALVVAMEEEEDEEVERELILALGRIGSTAAVQALIKFAQPGGRLFGRKPATLRATAVEALRLAATPAAIGTLEGLTDDGDKQVRAAAQGALADLKRK